MIGPLIRVLFIKNIIVPLILGLFLFTCNHILPYRQADLAAPASLQGIRGEGRTTALYPAPCIYRNLSL